MDDLSAIYNMDDNFIRRLNDYLEQGELILVEQRIILTKKGKLKADYIASSLFVE